MKVVKEITTDVEVDITSVDIEEWLSEECVSDIKETIVADILNEYENDNIREVAKNLLGNTRVILLEELTKG
ncbi:MAG: hypothetical protein LBH45_07200 [Campylobacteraceae bacterium]|jgi:hypothetical protein|nr:hypothetical protein [Campylobacteraceae bacterium]